MEKKGDEGRRCPEEEEVDDEAEEVEAWHSMRVECIDLRIRCASLRIPRWRVYATGYNGIRTLQRLSSSSI